eukprot:1537821-Prymnesium_polylepis.1
MGSVDESRLERTELSKDRACSQLLGLCLIRAPGPSTGPSRRGLVRLAVLASSVRRAETRKCVTRRVIRCARCGV